MADKIHSAGALLEQLCDASEQSEKIEVGELLDIVGERTHGPWLVLPALIGVTPIGGIPGVPTLLAILVALIAGQIAWGNSHIWLPSMARDRTIDTGKLTGTVKWLQPAADFLDRWTHRRLSFFVTKPVVRAGAFLTLALCAMVPPLEVVPFAVAVPFGAIALFGLALIIKDGILMLLALGVSMAASYFAVDLLF